MKITKRFENIIDYPTKEEIVGMGESSFQPDNASAFKDEASKNAVVKKERVVGLARFLFNPVAAN